MRNRLLSWFRSPALYGIYHFRSEVLQEETSEIAREMGGDVWREEAFPAYASSEALSRINTYLRAPELYPHRGAYKGPDLHRLAEVRCAHPLPDGSVCGWRARPWPRPDGTFYYSNTHCSSRGHTTHFAADLESAALSIIAEGYGKVVLESCLAGIRRAKGTEAARLQDLERAVQKLTAAVDSAAARVDKYDAEGAAKDSAFWEQRRKERSRELETAVSDHARARRAMDDASGLAEAEFRSILALAADIPELIRRAGSSPDRMRRLTRALAECVRVRSLGTGVYHVEVEFPSGQRVGRVHFVKKPAAAQAVRLLARSRLRAWLDPSRRTHAGDAAATQAADVLAGEINAGLPATPRSVAWTGARLLAAALLPEDDTAETPRRGKHETIDQLAARLGLEPPSVLWAAASGDLGPARLTGSELGLRPTTAELHRAFPDLARREVAVQRSWPLDDVILLEEFKAETGLPWMRIQLLASRGAGIANDAHRRRYTRRSLLPQAVTQSADEILRAALPSGADPSGGEWITIAEASSRMPGIDRGRLTRVAATACPGQGPNGERTVFVWIDDSTRARLRSPTLEEAIAALGRDDLRTMDFMRRDEVLALLRRNIGFPSDSVWQRAARSGLVLEVHASRTGWGRTYCYAYVPQWIRSTRSRTAVESFLRGAPG